ncbi:MAG: hypothetical protein LUD76_10160 [Alistipes sp.]|nr:hypothetical protein [Alistipes sp.]
MPSVFDDLAGQTFATVANLMGVAAVWRSSRKVHGEGTVLFKDPTEVQEIGEQAGIDYNPAATVVEYYEGTFPGLKEASDKNRTPQFLMVEDKKYSVLRVSRIHDGRTYLAYLEPAL